MRDKLIADLKRIFHGADPLYFIQDARIMETGSFDSSTYCEVILRVPTATEAAYKVYCDGKFWPDNPLANAKPADCKCSDKKLDPKDAVVKNIDPMDAVNWLTPERIIYSGPKTIVFWPDGTKTILSRMDGQEHDEYYAFCAAVVKKMFGSTPKAKKFLNSVKVNQESNPRKPKVEESCNG